MGASKTRVTVNDKQFYIMKDRISEGAMAAAEYLAMKLIKALKRHAPRGEQRPEREKDKQLYQSFEIQSVVRGKDNRIYIIVGSDVPYARAIDRGLSDEKGIVHYGSEEHFGWMHFDQQYWPNGPVGWGLKGGLGKDKYYHFTEVKHHYPAAKYVEKAKDDVRKLIDGPEIAQKFFQMRFVQFKPPMGGSE